MHQYVTMKTNVHIFGQVIQMNQHASLKNLKAKKNKNYMTSQQIISNSDNVNKRVTKSPILLKCDFQLSGLKFNLVILFNFRGKTDTTRL